MINATDTTMPDEAEDISAATKERSPISSLARIITTAARFKGDVSGLDTGEKAALARIDPYGEWRPHQIAALTRVLNYAGLTPEKWKPDTWKKWALIANGMALAGHDHQKRLGEQMSSAAISESRITRLLTARGDAFFQSVPRLARLLASKDQKPNWFELGNLILRQEVDEDAAEKIRLGIAANYFSAEAKKP